MSSSILESSSSTPNFRPIFEKALREYKKRTGEDLTAHPLAAEIQGCDPPEAILTVLEGKADELNQSRSSDERLTKWLNPTVNIINALSATLGEGAGLVFPPTKIIFSGIGILLVAAKSTVASRDVLIKLFDRIESFFERLRIYTNVPPSLAMTDELAKIMAEVLSILAIATKGMKEKRIKTFFKKVAGMNGLEDALQRFGELEQRELLTGIAQVSSDTNVLKDDAKETKAMVKEIAEKMDARDLEEVLQKLKRWLSPPDPSTNYNIGLRDLHEETATWFLEDRVFQEWHSTSSLLWIHGKPGSGKSILCSAIIQRIISLCHGGRGSVAYFYFDFRDENKKHRHNLLFSLLVQFAANSIPCCDIMSRVYSAHGKGTQQPSDDVLINCLADTLSAMTQHPIYIIVDALDECPNTSGVRSPRERVLSLIKHLVNLHLPNLHICVTSRPEVDIRIRLEPLTSLRVSLHDQTGHQEDIAKYIGCEVDVVANDQKWREDDKELVIETLSKKADGMFRWVYCQLEMLRLCLRSRVRQFINELPDGLDETYERILKGIYKTNQRHVHRLLQCLTVAIRPLRVRDLAAILTFDLDVIEQEVPMLDADRRTEDQEQELLSACPSLITIVEDNAGSRVVQFSHFSVKEFLTSDRLATSKKDISHYHIFPDAAHVTLTRASLGVLLRLKSRADARKMPLAAYAAEHWVSHTRVGSVSSRVMDMMEALFDSGKPHFVAWIRTYDMDRPLHRFKLLTGPVPKPDPLYYSALCGFYDLVEHLVKKRSPHVNATGSKNSNPLLAALREGHIRVAELLFQHDANVDVQELLYSVIQWPHPLTVSAWVGAVQFSLEHGADANARREDLSTPLHLAVECGRFEIAQVLLERGVDVNSRNVDGKTPLHMAPAFMRARGKLVQLLLKYGAEVNCRDKEDTTALHVASSLLHLETPGVLLDNGADINAEDCRRRTPLLRLLKPGTFVEVFDVVQLLVERGADVNTRDEDHETPLHLACSKFTERLQSVRFLLDHGANVNAKNKRGQTPLHRALPPKDTSKDRFGAAQLLVERGADVNAQDNDHETPLLLASSALDLELVRMLLDHGANVNAEDNRGQTALHRVLWVGDYPDGDRFRVAELLVERGAEVNRPNNVHETPLHLASRDVSVEKVWILLKHGADINAENKEGKTSFQLVRESMREEMERPPSEYAIRRARRAQGVALMGLFYCF